MMSWQATSLSVSLVFAQAAVPAASISTRPPLTAANWQEDLAYLAAEWPRRHKNLFHFVTDADWNAAVARLNERIPSLERHEIIVELGRLTAMIKDSHSGIGSFRQEAIDFHRIPIAAEVFTDGVFIVRASAQSKELVGAKIIKIGNSEISAVLDSVAQLIASDPGNSMRTRDIGPILLGMPEVMNAFRFIPGLDQIPLTLEKDGRRFTRAVQPVTRTDYDRIQWIDWRPEKPIALGSRNRLFWYAYMPSDKTIYVQINEMANDSTEYLAETFKHAVAEAESLKVDRFVIDLRYNGGGSSSAVRPMVISLIKSERIDQHGHLFALIGRETASAAQNFVNDLERLTNTVFIGEPTAQNPSFYSDGYVTTLPNSKIMAFSATRWFQTANSKDTRPYVAPDVVAEWSSNDYRTGRDPGLAAVRSYHARVSLPLQIVAIAERGGVRQAADSLVAVGNTGVARYRDLSQSMIRYSFDELWTNGHSEKAMLLLGANALAHPGDWNAHDALAGAHENKGEYALALAEYERARALNPTHRGVLDGIERVTAKLKH
ncbi:MAG: S41 family peptidase [Gemmatimonadales bacterium]